jgi:hypothetical protein
MPFSARSLDIASPGIAAPVPPSPITIVPTPNPPPHIRMI